MGEEKRGGFEVGLFDQIFGKKNKNKLEQSGFTVNFLSISGIRLDDESKAAMDEYNKKIM